MKFRTRRFRLKPAMMRPPIELDDDWKRLLADIRGR